MRCSLVERDPAVYKHHDEVEKEMQSEKTFEKHKSTKELYKERDWLESQYNSGKSQQAIADECGVSQATIHKWMKRFGILARDMHECHRGERNGAWIELPIKEKSVFEKDYIEEQLTLRQIAQKYGVSLRTVARWMKIHGIEPRTSEEWRQIHPLTGENNPNWRGGTSQPRCAICGKPISYGATLCRECRTRLYIGINNPNYKGKADIMALVREWSKEHWRPKILARDHYTCQLCGDDYGHNLIAHHIIPLHILVKEAIAGMPLETPLQRLAAARKAISSPLVQSLSNGITLCRKCHKEVHQKHVYL